MKHKRLIGYYCTCVALLALMQLWFGYSIGLDSTLRFRLITAFGEGVLLALPALVLRGRWRKVAPAVITLAALFYAANGMYLRYWGDLIPFSLIVSPASYNGLVFAAVPEVVRRADLMYVIVPASAWLMFAKLRISRQAALSAKASVLSAAGGVAVYITTVLLMALSVHHYRQAAHVSTSYGNSLRYVLWAPGQFSRTANWRERGLLLYCAYQFADSRRGGPRKLTDSLRTDIESFVTANADRNNAAADSMPALAENRSKNLIFIVVESLNAWVVGHEYCGRSVTPVLDSLLRAEGTVACLNVIPQVKDGGSSDGQLIYNTGLLPLVDGAAAMKYGGNAFCSLAKLPGWAETVEIIIEDGNIWNHRTTSQSYGYDRLIDNLPLRGRSMDRTLFEEAAAILPGLRQPFMAELTTLTMHYPYNDEAVENLGELSDLSDGSDESDPLCLRYLASVAEFDSALGSFLEALRRSGLADNSIIVLASDHDQGTLSDGSEENGGMQLPIVFIALNTGITASVEGVRAQTDVYPTVLALTGRKSTWTGVGTSMLLPRAEGAFDGKMRPYAVPDSAATERHMRARRTADAILRSDYFLSLSLKSSSRSSR